MNDPRNPDHGWALERLTVFGIGMLPEADTLRLEEHLAGCDSCRARLASLRPAPGADAAHLPASLIATWERTARLLGESERGLIASHLEACEACRAALAFAGHEPALPPRALTTPVRVPLPEPRSRAWGWALGFSTIAAATAVWLMVVQPALLPHDARTSATMSPLTAEPVSFEIGIPASTPGALALPEPARNAAPATAVAAVPAGDGVVLRLPASLLPAGPQDSARDVTLILLRGGHSLGMLHTRRDELGGAVRVRAGQPLAAGEYELRLVFPASERGTPARRVSFPLRVR